MLSEEEKELYSRHLLLDEMGMEGQLKLKKSAVLVIGAGGLGCPVLQYLCAAGVGRIGIADFDTVDKSNLQRQVLFGHSSIGKSKALEAKRRLNDLNPFIEIVTYLDGINIQNAVDMIKDFNVIIDCTDNYQTRYLVNDVCVLMDKPYVYGAIHKFEGQVSVFNLNGGPTYRCLYPEIPTQESIANCSESGVIGVLPGVIGALQANEAIKILAGIGTPLRGKLLMYCSKINEMKIFTMRRIESEFYMNLKACGALIESDYIVQCNTSELNDLSFLNEIYEQIVDVRDKGELPIIPNLKVLNIPLKELDKRYLEIDHKKKTIVFCKSGKRSQQAIVFLEKLDLYNNLENLEGGISSYLTQTT